MNPTAGSFVVDPRLQRLFVTLAVETPGSDSLMQIFGESSRQPCSRKNELATAGAAGQHSRPVGYWF